MFSRNVVNRGTCQEGDIPAESRGVTSFDNVCAQTAMCTQGNVSPN